ncbi:MAG: hypothetical protein AAFY72_10740 [Cyanobacteria bacterium J06649_4]
MAKRQLKVLLFSGAGAVGLIAATWLGITIAAKKQTAEMDAIANEALAQYSKTEQNSSAITLDELSAQVGLSLLSDTENSPSIDPKNGASFQRISDDLRDYFRAQSAKSQGPLDPIPETIQSFLNENQAALSQIQTHLNSQEMPIWDFEASRYANIDYAIPSYVGLVNLNKLLVLKAVVHAQQDQPEQMVSTLNAAQALIEIPMQRPDLISYLVSLITMDDNAAIVRHLENVPPSVTSQMISLDQQQHGVDRLRFDNWTFYRGLDRAINSPTQLEDVSFFMDSSRLAFVSPVVPYKSYLVLSNVNTTHLREKSHEQLVGKSICSLDVGALENELLEELPWWNLMGAVALPSFLTQWRKGGDRMLTAELTHLVVQAKALAAEQGKWPETLPNLESSTCPGEHWTYSVSSTGEMSLSFSRDFAWRQPNYDSHATYIPLNYTAQLSSSPETTLP